MLHINTLKEIAKDIPASNKSLRKKCQLNTNKSITYVVCSECNKLYQKSSSLIVHGHYGSIISATCIYVKFPNHPHYFRPISQCGEPLMRCVKFKQSQALKFIPCLTYCYYGIKQALVEFCKPKDFWELCSEWRNLSHTDGSFEDIYDEQVWLEDFKEFFSTRYNLGFLLNVDWFQPYKHSNYSLGVTYLAVANMPRRLCFKLENCIIVGIISGPKEPKGTIDTYLGPMVSELLELWQGCWIACEPNNLYIRCVLIGCACDTPASRKIGGFVEHSA